MSVRLFFFIPEFIKANALFTVLVVEKNYDFIIINVNAVYENINQPLFLLIASDVGFRKGHNPCFDVLRPSA